MCSSSAVWRAPGSLWVETGASSKRAERAASCCSKSETDVDGDGDGDDAIAGVFPALTLAAAEERSSPWLRVRVGSWLDSALCTRETSSETASVWISDGSRDWIGFGDSGEKEGKLVRDLSEGAMELVELETRDGNLRERARTVVERERLLLSLRVIGLLTEAEAELCSETDRSRGILAPVDGSMMLFIASIAPGEGTGGVIGGGRQQQRTS